MFFQFFNCTFITRNWVFWLQIVTDSSETTLQVVRDFRFIRCLVLRLVLVHLDLDFDLVEDVSIVFVFQSEIHYTIDHESRWNCGFLFGDIGAF